MTQRTHATADAPTVPGDNLAAVGAFWNNPIALVIRDAQTGTVLHCNSAFCELTGRAAAEMTGRTCAEIGAITASGEQTSPPANHHSHLVPGQAEVTVGRLDGELRIALAWTTTFESDGQLRTATQLFDITERKRTEGRLRLLDRIARLGYEASSEDEMLTGTLGALHAIFPEARAAFAWLEGPSSLRFPQSVGPTSMTDVSGLVVDLGKCPEYVAALRRGTPFAVRDSLTDPRFAPIYSDFATTNVRSFVDVPVRQGDETVGLLTIDSPKVRSWREDEIGTIVDAATQLALSLFRVKAEEALRQERELLQTVIDHVPDFLYIKDRQSRFTRANRAAAEFLGVARGEDVIGKSDFDFLPEELAETFFQIEQSVMETGIARVNHLEPQDAEGTRWALTTTVPVRDSSGQISGVVGTARDVTEIQEMQDTLRTSEARRRALLEALPDLVFRFDREGTYLNFLASQAANVDANASDKIGRTLHQVLPPATADRILAAIHTALDTGEVTSVEYEIRAGGTTSFQEARISPCADNEVVAVSRNVTERKMLEQRLAHQATHDPLTGIPNRTLFIHRLLGAVDLAAAQQTQIAVLYIDLDDFKQVNDELGHDAGDRMLAAVAERLKRAIRGGDTVARIGGDEFAILVDGIGTAADAEVVARRVSEHLSVPIRIGMSSVPVTASIGIAIGQPDRVAVDGLLIHADKAMYLAKRSGKNRLAVTDHGDGPHLLDLIPVPIDPGLPPVRAISLVEHESLANSATDRAYPPIPGARRVFSTPHTRSAG